MRRWVINNFRDLSMHLSNNPRKVHFILFIKIWKFWKRPISTSKTTALLQGRITIFSDRQTQRKYEILFKPCMKSLKPNELHNYIYQSGPEDEAWKLPIGIGR